jgi:hypothetical protein
LGYLLSDLHTQRYVRVGKGDEMSEQPELKLFALYDAVNHMMARLGHEGNLSANAAHCTMVLVALSAVDKGSVMGEKKFIEWSRRTEDAEITRLREQRAKLVLALEELYATVKGESPGLLNEDSGGSAKLDLMIQALLAEIEAEG